MKQVNRYIFLLTVLSVTCWNVCPVGAQGFKHTSQEDMYYMKMKNRTGSSGIGYFQIVDIHFKERMRWNHDKHDWFAWRFDIGGVPYFFIDDFEHVGNIHQASVNTAAVSGRMTTPVGNNWGHDGYHGWGSDYGSGGGGGGGGDRKDSRITWYPEMNMEEILGLAGNENRQLWEYGVDGNGLLGSSYVSIYGGDISSGGNGYAASRLGEVYLDGGSHEIISFQERNPSTQATAEGDFISVPESLNRSYEPATIVSEETLLISVPDTVGTLSLLERRSGVEMDGFTMETEGIEEWVLPDEMPLMAEMTFLMASNGLVTLGTSWTQTEFYAQQSAKASRMLRFPIAMEVVASTFSELNVGEEDDTSLEASDSVVNYKVSGVSAGGSSRKMEAVSPEEKVLSSVANDKEMTNSVPEPSSWWLMLWGLGWLIRKKRFSFR